MSLRNIFKRYLPEQHIFRDHRHLQMFGRWLHDHSIWAPTRRAVAGGVAIGLFCGMLPLIGQMLLAAALAIYFRVNLPISVVFTWVSNPFTFAPLFLGAYRIGTWVLDIPMQYQRFHLSYEWFFRVFHDIWLPLMTGSLILGIIAAAAGYYGTVLLWRILLLRKRDQRRTNRPFMRRHSDDE